MAAQILIIPLEKWKFSWLITGARQVGKNVR